MLNISFMSIELKSIEKSYTLPFNVIYLVSLTERYLETVSKCI